MTNPIGAKIAHERKLRGISQNKMAQLCGIPFSTLNQIETGHVKSPSAIKVKQIAVGLGVSVDYLLSDI